MKKHILGIVLLAVFSVFLLYPIGQTAKLRYCIEQETKYFPVGRDMSGDADVSFENSYGEKRSFGGERKHEGCDIMSSNNVPGYFPVFSVSDGIVENMGWLKLGGYRIGIRSKSGAYYYYAHLSSYSKELKQGTEVLAGDFLGYMGDSGYGTEGTTGQFPVHLHFGIYYGKEEKSVNPYWILRLLAHKRIAFKGTFVVK